MRIGEKILFSPKHEFSNLKWENQEKLIEAFKDRVQSFFFEPVRKLLESRKVGDGKFFAFSVGLLCVSTIDFLARLETTDAKVGERIKSWLKNNIGNKGEFETDELRKRFYEEFRCGLVHEGRIKNAGQFTYDLEGLLSEEGDKKCLIINPEILFKKIELSFESYIDKIKKGNGIEFSKFRCALIRDFSQDYEDATSIKDEKPVGSYK